MPHEVDQNVDAIASYQIGKCIIGESCCAVPLCGMRSKSSGDIIFLQGDHAAVSAGQGFR